MHSLSQQKYSSIKFEKDPSICESFTYPPKIPVIMCTGTQIKFDRNTM